MTFTMLERWKYPDIRDNIEKNGIEAHCGQQEGKTLYNMAYKIDAWWILI